MFKIAIIGLGNTLRRDDGIGIIILQSLLRLYKKEEVDYLDFGTASFDLINRFQNYDIVFLIDAINAGINPGDLKIFKLDDIACNLNEPAISTHELNLTGLFELYKKFGLKTKIYITGIQVKDTSFGLSLSDPLKQRVEEITEKINSFIDNTVLV